MEIEDLKRIARHCPLENPCLWSDAGGVDALIENDRVYFLMASWYCWYALAGAQNMYVIE